MSELVALVITLWAAHALFTLPKRLKTLDKERDHG